MTDCPYVLRIKTLTNKMFVLNEHFLCKIGINTPRFWEQAGGVLTPLVMKRVCFREFNEKPY